MRAESPSIFLENIEQDSARRVLTYLKPEQNSLHVSSSVFFYNSIIWPFLYYFVLKSFLGIARQWNREEFAILSLKPLSHVSILICQNWAITYLERSSNRLLQKGAMK